MDAADLELFERSLRHVTERHTGGALDAALEELGWSDAAVDDRRAAVSLLFDLQGRANATSSAIGALLTATSGAEAVLPALGTWTPPGEVEGARVAVRGLTMGVVRADLLVVARRGDKDVVLSAPVAELTVREVDGVDPALQLAEVSGTATATEVGPADWSASVATCRLALGHELVGASRKMLELACQHALEREQFGRPIAAFQAVRHRLADTLVAIETAEAMLDGAWLDQSPESAAMAKAVAGRGARTAARHCQQVLAGIGFTTEHPLHRYIRRVLVLDELFGSARSLTHQLGAELLRTRQLPPLLPL
jgi:alkylation response protein AidB-like acyl-CoA dehydrogenase